MLRLWTLSLDFSLQFLTELQLSDFIDDRPALGDWVIRFSELFILLKRHFLQGCEVVLYGNVLRRTVMVRSAKVGTDRMAAQGANVCMDFLELFRRELRREILLSSRKRL